MPAPRYFRDRASAPRRWRLDTLARFSWDRGRPARFYTPVGLRPTCGRLARDPSNPSTRRFSRDRGRLARFNTRVGLPPTCGRLARFNSPVGLRPTCGRAARGPRDTRSARRLPWDRGQLARLDTPVGLRPTCGRAARDPRDTRSARRLPRDRGQLARLDTPVGLRPTCGRAARGPRNPSARRLSLGPRAACPLGHTGGPAAHLRAGRPRSQGNPSARRLPRDRGRLARFNSPVGLRPTCGRAARGPRNPSARRLSLGPRAARPLQHTGGPSAHLRAGRPRSQGGTLSG